MINVFNVLLLSRITYIGFDCADGGGAGGDDIREQLKLAGERQLTALVEWARHIPHFLDLPVGDQVG